MILKSKETVENLGGISGTGSANYSNWRTLLWLGEIDVGDQDDFNTLEGRIVVANGGFIKPGYVDYDGGRRGRFSVRYSAPQGQYPRLDTLEFRDGAKLKVTLRPDGTCSWLDASQTQSAGTFLDVTLAGDLVLEEVGRMKSGNGPWIVLKTGKETTGSFANAGANRQGHSGLQGFLQRSAPRRHLRRKGGEEEPGRPHRLLQVARRSTVSVRHDGNSKLWYTIFH